MESVHWWRRGPGMPCIWNFKQNYLGLELVKVKTPADFSVDAYMFAIKELHLRP